MSYAPGTAICEIRKVIPGADYFRRDSQPVVERFVFGHAESVAYAALLTEETGVKHVAWYCGFFDRNGNPYMNAADFGR